MYSKEMPDRTPADMRDAIQGMLSMSRGLHVNSNESGESAFEFRSKLPSKKKEQRISESSPTHRDVYKDEEFGNLLFKINFFKKYLLNYHLFQYILHSICQIVRKSLLQKLKKKKMITGILEVF